jgi:thiamine-phosphate pyrophosphorylase
MRELNRSKQIQGYYFITDAQLSRAGNARDVKQAVAAGVKVVQYRSKEGSTAALYTEALALKKICRQTLFLVNDRLDIALAVDADGVHVGQDDLPLLVTRSVLGPHKVIGVTVHSVLEARQAAIMGADYLGVSPIFATRTKRDAGRAVGIELLRQIKSVVDVPVVAIGGINLDNAPDVVRAGADSLCAISAVVSRADVKGEIARFQRLFR